MTQSLRIAVVPGDGIGVDVTREAVKVLEAAAAAGGFGLEMENFDYNADRYLETGVGITDEEMQGLAAFDGIYMGAFGDPRVPDMAHARDILLGARFKLDLYVNHRPIKLLSERLCPLRDRGPEDVDFVVFRENTEGLYAGVGGIFKQGTPDEIALQEDINTRKGVERIIRHAFEYARKHDRPSVVMSDKSNALRYGHDLWQRVFWQTAEEYEEIEARHLYVDALVMQMVKNPGQFDVIVTCNMFGDIVTDLGAQLQGGLGLASSANVHPGGSAMFEPVHGSAPKYTGQDVANPLAAILTAAMMLEHLGQGEAAAWIEKAVMMSVAEYKCTRDIGGKLGTSAVGDWVADAISKGV